MAGRTEADFKDREEEVRVRKFEWQRGREIEDTVFEAIIRSIL